MDIQETLRQEFSLKSWQVENLLSLLKDGNTIPFIARYRKEMHGSLDDQVLRLFEERLHYLTNLFKRKEEVQASIEAQEKWNDTLKAKLDGAATLAEVEDLYRPFKQKRKTRGSVARERGLSPFSEQLLTLSKGDPAPLSLAADYVSPKKGISSPEEALQGALDIIAEDLSDDADLRRKLRALFLRRGVLVSAGTTEEDSVYRLYTDFQEPVRQVPGHRILAINRGEREGFLKVTVRIPEPEALPLLENRIIPKNTPIRELLQATCQDAYRRLLLPSLEREIRNTLTDRADEDAIHVFAVNLRGLLMQPPFKNRVTLGMDPGYRTGCKLAVVDGTGRVLSTGVIYPAPPHQKIEEAKNAVRQLIETYGIQAIAIGNGTASRETEAFTASLLKEMDTKAAYMIVSEAGASVYSASQLAAKEFPDFDVSLRSAVSIARRLQDPLAELVKIDPKSIGVGQYQHDMPPVRLGEALSSVVEDCVNAVGADLNTASAPLLTSIAGVSANIAENIVRFREENGPFPDRKTLLKVPKLGPKTFLQCAGFLRVTDGKNSLDSTAVHPESYEAAKNLLSLCGFPLTDVKNGHLKNLSARVEEKGAETIAKELGIGLPTLKDIVLELQKPGRDPRDELPRPLLRKDVLELKDLSPGMELTGTVRNVIDFGAFIDIGVHEDGLVHISQLSERFVKHPSEVVQVGDLVKVSVLSVDPIKKRISLTMKVAKSQKTASQQ